MNLLTLNPVPAAVAAALSSPVQFREGIPRNLVLQGFLSAYTSGGTTIDAWVQTSVDDQKSWTDVANFHFTTSIARFLFNLSSLTPVTAEYTPTDGTLTANTSKDGIIGAWLRVKYTIVGTYVGAILTIDSDSTRLQVYP